jgi:hypothetical protein
MLSVLFQILLGVVVAHASQGASAYPSIIDICSPTGPTARILGGNDAPGPDHVRYPHCPACFLTGFAEGQADGLRETALIYGTIDEALVWTDGLDRPVQGQVSGAHRARAPPFFAQSIA